MTAIFIYINYVLISKIKSWQLDRYAAHFIIPHSTLSKQEFKHKKPFSLENDLHYESCAQSFI